MYPRLGNNTPPDWVDDAWDGNDPISYTPTVISTIDYQSGAPVPVLIQPAQIDPRTIAQPLPDMVAVASAPASSGAGLIIALLLAGLWASRKSGGTRSW